MKFKPLINFHSHSHHSLDGAATVPQIIQRNVELGAPYVSLTEHGNQNSAMELYMYSKKNGVKPILGIEAYVEHPFKDFLRAKFEVELADRKQKKAEAIEKKLKGAYVHLTIHFKDAWAYQYFCELSPKMEVNALVKWGERKPLMTWEDVAAAKGHVVLGSSCLGGPIQSLVHSRDKSVNLELAEQAYCMVRDLAGPENFYVEVFPHALTREWIKPKLSEDDGKVLVPGVFAPIGCNALVEDSDIQRFTNEFVLAMAKKYGDKALISLDSHFALPSQKLIQDCRLGNGQERWRMSNSYHIMTTDECADELKQTLKLTDKDIEEMVDNSYAVASMFDDFKLFTNNERWVLPEVGENWLMDLKAKIDRHGRMDWADQTMIERLKYEVNILSNNGKLNLLPYFFIVEDIANFCRDNDILINTRGSAGGSLLMYLLGVSAVNPLTYNLSFGRFLTVGRIKANTLPDADLDISSNSRDRVFEYLKQKYGDGFCRISTDCLLKLRSSIHDAERSVLGYVRPETEALCKRLPAEQQGTESRELVFGKYADDGTCVARGLIETHDDLQKYAKENPELWEIITQLLGIIRQKGGHACGTIISSEPVQKYSPIMTIHGERWTGYSPKSAEAAGLVKFDILGLCTLDDIQGCLRSIKERLGQQWDWMNLPYDTKVFDAFCQADTATVFQFDTDAVRPYLSDIRPRSIEALAAITSLVRPGTLDAPYGDGRTLAQVYVARADGENIEYIHPDLATITGETFGVNLYQEQTIAIFKHLANYSDEQAETVRRGIGKKDEKVLNSCMGDLRVGCKTRGWTDQQVDLLIEQIHASARYSFNLSHAVSYALVAYACMYLKVKYPLDWWKAVLTNASKDEVASKFWVHVSGFTTLPDINRSGDGFKIVDDKIVAPLSIVNGIGEKAFQQLLKNAPYSSLMDYIQKHHAKRSSENDYRSAVHSGITRKLIASGMMDSLFGPYKDEMVEYKLEAFERAKSMIREEPQEPVPEEYRGMTALGKYMIKKELVTIYSEDLRPLVLGNRGAFQNGNKWTLQKGDEVVEIISGLEFTEVKRQVEQGVLTRCNKAVLAYVVKERPFQYKNKLKQANELILDVDGIFFKEVLWPAYECNTAPTGFAKKPALIYFRVWTSQNKPKPQLSLTYVQPLILDRSETQCYDTEEE